MMFFAFLGLQGLKFPNIKNILLTLALVVIVGMIVFFFWFYLKHFGLRVARAAVRIESQSGGRWVFDTIVERKEKGIFYYTLRKAKHPIPPPQDAAIAPLGKKGRIAFLNRHQTAQGRFYYTYIKYYDAITVSPSTEAQTFEFMAPMNTQVMEWAINKEREVAIKYPAWYEKHPGLVAAGIFLAGIISMTMIVVVLNVAR